jgi:antitoxin ParD1/3/4
MNVSLTAELEHLVNEKVASGMYHSASEVIREGLRLLKERDDLRRVQMDEVRRDVMLGVEQVRTGRGKKYDSGAEVADGIKRHRRQRSKKSREGDE